MSRFSGPQHRGAAHDLAVVRRIEAKERQAAERARDAARAAVRDATPTRPLTDRELDELLAAARTVQMAAILHNLDRTVGRLIERPKS